MWDQIIGWGVFAFVMLCFFGVVSAFTSFVGGVLSIGDKERQDKNAQQLRLLDARLAAWKAARAPAGDPSTWSSDDERAYYAAIDRALSVESQVQAELQRLR